MGKGKGKRTPEEKMETEREEDRKGKGTREGEEKTAKGNGRERERGYGRGERGKEWGRAKPVIHISSSYRTALPFLPTCTYTTISTISCWGSMLG